MTPAAASDGIAYANGASRNCPIETRLFAQHCIDDLIRAFRLAAPLYHFFFGRSGRPLRRRLEEPCKENLGGMDRTR